MHQADPPPFVRVEEGETAPAPENVKNDDGRRKKICGIRPSRLLDMIPATMYLITPLSLYFLYGI